MTKRAVLTLLALLVLTGCKHEPTAREIESACPSGHSLILQRGLDMPETFRACVLTASDCPFIADVMQRAEPRVLWYCR